MSMKRIHSDSKRDEILQAAIRLFARQGVEGTTVKDIGKEAGVTDAALYKHFSSKEEVAFAVFAHYSDQYTKLVDHHAGRKQSFRLRLDGLVKDVVELHDAHRFGLLLLGQRHDIFARLSSNHRLPIMAVTDFIASGVQSGEIPTQSPRLTAALLIGALTRMAVFSDMGTLPHRLGDLLPEIQQRIRGLVGLE